MILPNICNPVAVAIVLAIITSSNQIAVGLFVTGPGLGMLPIEMVGLRGG